MRQLQKPAAIGAAALVLAASAPQLPVATSLDRYARGEYDAALTSLDLTRLSAGELHSEAELWIHAADAPDRARRPMVAAAFAVDALWTATRHRWNRFEHNVDPVRAVFDRDRVSLSNDMAGFVVIGWAQSLVPRDGPVTQAERWWRLAALGVLQDGHAWTTLLEADHLGRARERLPDEVRLRMIEAVARTAHDLGTLREGNRARADVLRDERLGSSVTRRIPNTIATFEALGDDPVLAGEAHLRIGYLELRRREWDHALDRFRLAETALTDPFLQAVAGYTSGWVLEQRERYDEAVIAYRRANLLAPGMRSVATLLAARLFLDNRRDDAHEVLKTMYASPPPFELLTMFERGDARFVPGYLARLREALR